MSPERTSEGAPIGRLLLGGIALTVAAPIYDVLSRNPEFFAVRGHGRADLILTVVAFSVVLPLLAICSLVVASKLAPTFRPFVAPASAGVLIAIYSLQVSRWLGLASFAAAMLALAALAAAWFLAARRPRTLVILSWLWPVAIFLPGYFLFSSWSGLSSPKSGQAIKGSIPNKPPIVLVVLDELSVVSLLDEHGSLDAKRFPNIARLAASGEWFRNATTTSALTTQAIPSMLTGETAQPDQMPTLAAHPRNLFTLLEGHYTFNVWEEATRLCPPHLASSAPQPLLTRAQAILSDVGIVYLHTIVPRDLAEALPPITQNWGSFAPIRDHTSQDRVNRVSRFRLFLNRISASSQAQLNYFHLMLPHQPYEFYPSGKRFRRDPYMPGLRQGSDLIWAGPQGLLDVQAQAHLSQVAFVDMLIGELLARLRAEGLMEKSVIILASDHGVAFRSGRHARTLDAPGEGGTASTLLIVKQPGVPPSSREDQRISADVLPTVLDAIGVQPAARGDGVPVSLSHDVNRPFTRFDANGKMQQIPRSDESGGLVMARLDELDWYSRTFNTESAGGFPTLTGCPIPIGRAVPGEARPVSVVVDQDRDLSAVAPDSGYVPGLITGRITVTVPLQDHFVLAVNGVVWAPVFPATVGPELRFAALVPEQALKVGRNNVQLFSLPRDNTVGVQSWPARARRAG